MVLATPLPLANHLQRVARISDFRVVSPGEKYIELFGRFLNPSQNVVSSMVFIEMTVTRSMKPGLWNIEWNITARRVFQNGDLARTFFDNVRQYMRPVENVSRSNDSAVYWGFDHSLRIQSNVEAVREQRGMYYDVTWERFSDIVVSYLEADVIISIMRDQASNAIDIEQGNELPRSVNAEENRFWRFARSRNSLG